MTKHTDGALDILSLPNDHIMVTVVVNDKVVLHELEFNLEQIDALIDALTIARNHVENRIAKRLGINYTA